MRRALFVLSLGMLLAQGGLGTAQPAAPPTDMSRQQRLREHEMAIQEIVDRRNAVERPSRGSLDAMAFAPDVPVSARLRAVLSPAAPPIVQTNVGISFVDLETGQSIFAYGGSKLMTPASTLKTHTSSCAFETWGPEHRFQTTLLSSVPPSNGVLTGDLILVGGGDPMLKSSDLAAMAKALREEKGITSITGNLVLDVSRFDIPLKGPGWMWDDDPDYYNMSVSPLMVDFNVATLKTAESKSGGAPQAAFDPAADFPPIQLKAVDDITTVTIRRRPFEEPFIVEYPSSGPYAAAKSSLTVLHSDQWVGSLFKGFLMQNGVELRGEVVLSHAPLEGTTLLVREGSTLDETVRHFHKVSENAVGEMLLLNLAVEANGRAGTWNDGAEVITKWLTGTAGVPEGTFRLVDGSGLSRYNVISGDSSIALLTHMWKSPLRDAWVDTLTKYEVELRPDAPAGLSKYRVRAKSGGMGGVTTLIGYLETEKGRWVAFSWLANGYIGSNKPISDVRKKMLSVAVTWDPEHEATIEAQRQQERRDANMRRLSPQPPPAAPVP
ncbi:D-alanyl-D-alanine carboxypeptidase/D-alanyl-D-alanine-endopeptidase [bacterium]|nr:D-alanyl-D-alanine carboxypeptidase/D-alanyl-D-alanine-endopeptidase [bacterium]